MVQHGDFVVELVEANTKMPFKEHSHDDKTFFEVEPDQEYFIAIRKQSTKHSSGMVAAKCYVDGQDLGYKTPYEGGRKYASFTFLGCWKVNSQTSTMTALKFVEMRKSASSAEEDKAPVGKIEVKLFQGINPRPYVTSTTVESVKIVGEVSGKVDRSKKIVRSTNGECNLAVAVSPTRYDCGPLLSTITLHYCTTPGLISMGVIPGLGPKNQQHKVQVKQENERKRRAVSPPDLIEASSENQSDDETVVLAKPTAKAVWTVDLTGFDSD